MSRFPELLLGALIAALLAPGTASAQGLGLGREATGAEIDAWDIDVRPDGQGLPEGSGTVAEGEVIFTERCAVCHGDFGEGVDRWPPLAGGEDTLDSERPVKTVGSYWPYLSTVYDYVHRAMPFGDAQSLSDDETYALTAYILYLNYIVEDEEFELSAANFGDIEMPNEGGFIADGRPDFPTLADGPPCMAGCKDAVEITARARVLDVTPDDGADTSAEAASPAAGLEMVAEGAKVFRRCSACHQVGPDARNRVGPVLTGVVGSPAGQVEGFAYSPALAEAAEGGLVWDEAALAAFLAQPRDFVRGTRMAFGGLRDQDDINALIAYLAAQIE